MHRILHIDSLKLAAQHFRMELDVLQCAHSKMILSILIHKLAFKKYQLLMKQNETVFKKQTIIFPNSNKSQERHPTPILTLVWQQKIYCLTTKLFSILIVKQLKLRFRMGCHQSSSALGSPMLKINPSLLKVVTLNYCGILKSPYEFYSGSHQNLLEVLSAGFKKMMPKYAKPNEKGEFQWNFGQLDKRIGSDRYSPLYCLNAGIQNGKFMTKSRFLEIWHQKYQKAIQKINFVSNQAIKLQALQFDLLAFHTLLQNVYNIQQIDQAASLDPKPYLKKYGPLFQQSFLNEQKKCSELALKIGTYDFDIFFLQQASEGLIKTLSTINKFHSEVSSDRNTLILINKKRFSSCGASSQLLGQLTEEERKQLNWNGHTSIAVADNYILLNCHLSSKKKVNQENMHLMKESLKMLKSKFPSYQIICAGDANNPVAHFSSDFSIFPETESKYTSLKKRSYLQAQYSKSDKQVKAAKDYVISTLRVVKGQIVTIQGKQPTETTFLPFEQHPYDHFLVKVELCEKEAI